MKTPASVLAVDAAVLIAAALGRNSDALETAAKARYLVVTERAMAEARRRLELGLKRPDLLPLLDRIAAAITVVPERDIESQIGRAETALKNAAASQNGATRDAHVLACAWVTEADIWSFDRDFAGTGVASWSTANLMRALAEQAISE